MQKNTAIAKLQKTNFFYYFDDYAISLNFIVNWIFKCNDTDALLILNYVYETQK